MSTASRYPARVHGQLDEPLSRWLWLVKWLLGIPHFIVLFFLWIAFVVLTVIAFFAILFTGRYPRGIFDFNVGVLRWSWRVAFWSYYALGTDRYPPFSLGEEPDYPARLDVDYPEQLSRGLVLVKWWLLAIPHYIVIGIFASGGWLAWREESWRFSGPSLIGILVFFAGVMLLFANRYPGGLFNFVMGLNRWVVRVVAYAGLMRDEYPPFRLDMGGDESGGTPVVPAAPAVQPQGGGGGVGRIVLLVVGSIVALVSLAVIAAGGVAIGVDQTQRDSAGFVASDIEAFSTSTHALVSDKIEMSLPGRDSTWRDLFGTVRLRAESDHDLFLGIARSEDVDAYLGGVGREQVDDITRGDHGAVLAGGAPSTPPGEQTFWAASTSGTGQQALDWEVADGTWTAVVMNADGSSPVDAGLSLGAELPQLFWIGVGVLSGGVLLLAVSILLIVLGARSRPRGPSRAAVPAIG